ncbi:MAG: futalosine hydrolase, partial [Bacteroidota bacterium]
REQASRTEANVLVFDRVSIEVLFTGVGLTATSFALGHRFGRGNQPQLAIQAGVGGAIDRSVQLGEVVSITTETFGDLGAETAAGQPLSLTDIGLPPGAPFTEQGQLAPEVAVSLPFRACAGLTVNQVSGSAATIRKRTEQFPYAQVESMEGAAFFYACLQAGVEPLQLRSISNYVEPRNREAWRMAEAITSLNQALRQVLTPFISE